MYIKHGLIYLLAKVAPVLASFISIAAYTRWLSTEEYGIYTTLVIFASSLNGFLFGWLNISVMRFWDTEAFSAMAMQRLVSFTVMSIVIVIGFFAAAYALFVGHTLLALAFFILFSSSALYESYQRVNIVSQQVNLYFQVEVIRTLLTLLAGLALVWLGYSWFGIVIGVILGSLCALFFSRGISRYVRFYWDELDLTLLKKTLQYGLPLSFSAILLDVIYTSDRFLLSLLQGTADAGKYTAAYNIPHQIILMLTSSLNLAAYPVIVRVLENDGQTQAEKKFKQYLLVLLGVTIPAVFGLVGISRCFVPLLMGSEFVESTIMLWPWIGVAVLSHCLYSFYIFLSFQLAKRTTDAIKVVAVGALASLPLNVILISTFGLKGAVISSAIAYLLCVIYGYLLGRNSFKMNVPWVDLFKVLIASCIMLFAMNHLVDMANVTTIILKILLGVLVYAGMVLLLNIGDVRVYFTDFKTVVLARYMRAVSS